MQSPATVSCPLELEIAKTVVLPRLRDLAREVPPRSKSHLYSTWCEKWGPLSRARFDAWLDMLEISFIRVVVVNGLDEPDPKSGPSPMDERLQNAIFDNENDEDFDGEDE